MSVCGKNFNNAILSDTMDMINVKLCMMIVLIELCPFVSLSVTLPAFEGHSSVKQFQLNFCCCSHQIKLELLMIVDYVKQIINIPLFLTFAHVRGR